jgi:DNA invertase Pin-like site-specific DNA recombinase
MGIGFYCSPRAICTEERMIIAAFCTSSGLGFDDVYDIETTQCCVTIFPDNTRTLLLDCLRDGLGQVFEVLTILDCLRRNTIQPLPKMAASRSSRVLNCSEESTMYYGAVTSREGKSPGVSAKVAEMLESLRANDAIVVSELSRLGRSMLECMEILSVDAQKRINVYSVKGAWRLDQSIQSKIIAMAYSMAAEIERDLILQRTKEALRFKKAHGMKFGRPTGLGKSKRDPYRPEIESLLANGSTQKFIARRYQTTEANLHDWLKKRGLK